MGLNPNQEHTLEDTNTLLQKIKLGYFLVLVIYQKLPIYLLRKLSEIFTKK